MVPVSTSAFSHNTISCSNESFSIIEFEPILETLLGIISDSNASQFLKAFEYSFVTEFGITMSFSDEHPLKAMKSTPYGILISSNVTLFQFSLVAVSGITAFFTMFLKEELTETDIFTTFAVYVPSAPIKLGGVNAFDGIVVELFPLTKQ